MRRGDVLSCWTGLRPLVMDPNKADTQSLARNHIIEVGKDNLITIAGMIQHFQGGVGAGKTRTNTIDSIVIKLQALVTLTKQTRLTLCQCRSLIPFPNHKDL